MRLFDIESHNFSEILDSGRELFRGVENQTEDFIGTIRGDRNPKNSSINQAKVFDMVMEEFDLPFRKSNSLSVSTAYGQAATYGNVFQIYPFDDALYLTTDLYDLITLPGRILGMSGILDFFELDKIREYIRSNKPKIMRETGIIATDNPDKIRYSAGEVLVYGTKYYARRM